jgi:hypothetical protein
MQTEKTDREVLAEFGIVFDSRPDARLSQFGGLTPILEFLKKGHIRERLEELFGKKKARSILQLGVGIVAGAGSLDEAYRVSRDPMIHKFLGNPVVATELGRDFKAFTKVELEQFHDFNQSLAILELLQFVKQEEELIFDVDATSVQKYGHQQGVEKGYIEKDKLEECYQYLLFRLHNLNTFFYGTIRGGAAHSQNGYTGYLARFLPAFKRQWKVCFRTDSGYFSEDAIDIYSENEARFFCKAPMSEQRQSFAEVFTDLVWIADPKNSDVAYASYVTRTKKGTIYREIYKRAKINKAQMSLLESASYRYDCLSTNDLVIQDRDAFAFYNGRANVENNIKELKQDYALGKIVTEQFDANDAITQVTLFFYLLVQHFKRMLLPDDMQRLQLSTLRWRVMNIPGSLFRGARRQWIRIQNVFAQESLYAAMFRKLLVIRSWILAPPESLSTAA